MLAPDAAAPNVAPIELRLSGAPSDVAEARRSGVVSMASGGAWRRRRSVFFDTPDGRLRRAGLTVERRYEGGGVRDIVSRAPEEKALLAAGTILARAPAGGRRFPPLTANAETDDLMAAAAGDIEVVAEIEADIWTGRIDRNDAVIEATVHLGSGRGSTAAAFVALRQTDGDPAIIFDVARAIVSESKGRVRPDFRDAPWPERAGGDLGKTPKIDLAAADTPADAFALGLSVLARRLCTLAPQLIEARDGEAGWQMRIALRRWRSLERVFRPAVRSNALRDLNQSARLFAKLIGAARDWEVFLSETLPAAAERSDPRWRGAGYDLLRATAEAERADAFDLAASAIAGPAFAGFLLDLVEAAALTPWRAGAKDQVIDQPIRTFADAALDRRLDRARATAAAIDPAAPETLHALRLDLKKLRYTAQTFRQLYPKDHRKPYFTALADLQEILGQLNDAVVAQTLASDAARGQGTLAAQAAGYICGYKSAEADAAVSAVSRDWAGFEAAAPYWRADPEPAREEADPLPENASPEDETDLS